MAVKFSRHYETEMLMFLLLATIDRDKYTYKSVSHIPVCPKLSAKVWLVWLWPDTNFCETQYTTGPHSHTVKGLAIHMHAANLVESPSLVSTGEHAWATSLMGIQTISDELE